MSKHLLTHLWLCHLWFISLLTPEDKCHIKPQPSCNLAALTYNVHAFMGLEFIFTIAYHAAVAATIVPQNLHKQLFFLPNKKKLTILMLIWQQHYSIEYRLSTKKWRTMKQKPWHHLFHLLSIYYTILPTMVKWLLLSVFNDGFFITVFRSLIYHLIFSLTLRIFCLIAYLNPTSFNYILSFIFLPSWSVPNKEFSL